MQDCVTVGNRLFNEVYLRYIYHKIIRKHKIIADQKGKALDSRTYAILIVEDSKLINDNLKKQLEDDGHETEQAFDLESAIALIQTNRFDYVLLDLILPDGEGEMLLPYAKRADVRVIVMTTDRDSFRRDRLFGFGIVDYIIKERYFDDIIENIRRIIRQVESNAEYTILIVDDSNFIRNNLELLLHSRGFLVLTATNGKEALETMEKYPIDALIADLEMPVVDGFALMAKLRRHKVYKNLPVMILTGSGDSNKIAKVIKHDVRDLIKKPYVIEEVLLKIDNMINTLKQQKIIQRERNRFNLYHEAIVNSTLYMKLTPHLSINYINERLRTLLGIAFSPLNKPLLPTLLADTNLQWLDSLGAMRADMEPQERVYVFRGGSGTQHYVSAVVSGVFDESGRLLELVFIGHDISQMYANEHLLHERIEEQTMINIEQQRVMFNQAKMAAMGEMIGNIAHQWRQPLNTLGLLIQDLDDAQVFGELDDAYLHTMISKSMDQIQYMSKTIDDFRNFFQPDKQKVRFSVADAINKTVDIVEKMLQINGITLHIENLEGVSDVVGYPGQMQQVLLNLVNNAKDAIGSVSGGKTYRDKWIRIAARQEGMTLIISIEDNGGGIPEEIMDRIFEPYYTTKEEGKGTGIGLYMSKMIIEQNMGGRLSVRNAPEGACFEIALSIGDRPSDSICDTIA